MPSNFSVFMHQNNDNIHLRLFGDFDGSSAWQLIDILKQYCLGPHRIFIHTSGLSTFHPFGIEVFQKETQNYRRLNNNLVFTGRYGSKLKVVSKPQIMHKHKAAIVEN